MKRAADWAVCFALLAQGVTMILWMMLTDLRISQMQSDVDYLYGALDDLEDWQAEHEGMNTVPFRVRPPTDFQMTRFR